MAMLDNSFRRRWTNQMLQWHARYRSGGMRRGAAVRFLYRKRQPRDLELMHDMKILVVYDERIPSGLRVIRASGYHPQQSEYGISWAGYDQGLFCKYLSSMPRRGRYGAWLDTRNGRTLHAFLHLNQMLTDEQDTVSNSGVLVLPSTWAGFTTQAASGIKPSGPELEQLCKKFELTTEAMIAKFTRHHNRQKLFPLDWVSDQLDTCVDLYVEPASAPFAQVIAGEENGNFRGYQGSSEYDFFANRCRPAESKRNRRQPSIAPAGLGKAAE